MKVETQGAVILCCLQKSSHNAEGMLTAAVCAVLGPFYPGPIPAAPLRGAPHLSVRAGGGALLASPLALRMLRAPPALPRGQA